MLLSIILVLVKKIIIVMPLLINSNNSECQDFVKIYRNYELSYSLLFLFSFSSHTDLNAYKTFPESLEIQKLIS